MELKEAIRNRRSIRAFSHYHVSDDEIRSVIDVARLAPSWANTQVWEFVVVRDRDLIRQVTETYSETNPARKGSLASSAIIVVCAKMNVSGCRDGNARTKFHEWFMFDLGLSVQNLCLRAFEIGLGTVIVGSMDHDRCRGLLAIPDGFEPVVAIPIGRPATEPGTASQRRELNGMLHLNRFGTRYEKAY
ncbi:MAG: nitroreductase [Chrysiogenales bacterium]|nr:MAG: nitroreductase [Chrysiogenales bacterium]